MTTVKTALLALTVACGVAVSAHDAKAADDPSLAPTTCDGMIALASTASAAFVAAKGISLEGVTMRMVVANDFRRWRQHTKNIYNWSLCAHDPAAERLSLTPAEQTQVEAWWAGPVARAMQPQPAYAPPAPHVDPVDGAATTKVFYATVFCRRGAGPNGTPWCHYDPTFSLRFSTAAACQAEARSEEAGARSNERLRGEAPGLLDYVTCSKVTVPVTTFQPVE
jgi:hypothetical protein